MAKNTPVLHIGSGGREFISASPPREEPIKVFLLQFGLLTSLVKIDPLVMLFQVVRELMAAVVLGHKIDVIHISGSHRRHKRFLTGISDGAGRKSEVLVCIIWMLAIEVFPSDLGAHRFYSIDHRRV